MSAHARGGQPLGNAASRKKILGDAERRSGTRAMPCDDTRRVCVCVRVRARARVVVRVRVCACLLVCVRVCVCLRGAVSRTGNLLALVGVEAHAEKHLNPKRVDAPPSRAEVPSPWFRRATPRRPALPMFACCAFACLRGRTRVGRDCAPAGPNVSPPHQSHSLRPRPRRFGAARRGAARAFLGVELNEPRHVPVSVSQIFA